MNKTILKGFIGTYTNTDSRGIYNFEFDCENKVFKTHALAYEIEKPSYLAIDKENNILYSVSKDKDLGGVTSFRIKENLSLERINSVLETENPPCYINFSNKQGLIFTANYHHNKVNIYPIEDGHRIGKTIKTLTHTNNTPHIHYADLDPEEDFLLTVDLGQDYINLYEVKENDFIEREDFMENPPKKYFRLFPGNEVRLKGAYCVKCNEVIKDENGEVTEIHCTYDPETKSGTGFTGRKVKGTIHWVDANNCIPAEFRLYEPLILDDCEENEGKHFLEQINPNSLTICKGFIEPSAKDAKPQDKYQLFRHGYFNVDPNFTSDDNLVFNRIVSLKSSFKLK